MIKRGRESKKVLEGERENDESEVGKSKQKDSSLVWEQMREREEERKRKKYKCRVGIQKMAQPNKDLVQRTCRKAIIIAPVMVNVFDPYLVRHKMYHINVSKCVPSYLLSLAWYDTRPIRRGGLVTACRENKQSSKS